MCLLVGKDRWRNGRNLFTISLRHRDSGILLLFWSRKMHAAELNYGVGETEILAIVEACKEWRYYLEAIHLIPVITDYCNLRTFLTTKNLSRREAR